MAHDEHAQAVRWSDNQSTPSFGMQVSDFIAQYCTIMMHLKFERGTKISTLEDLKLGIARHQAHA